MLEQSWMYVITNVGFPIFVASFVLVRLEPTLKRLTEAICSLEKTIVQRR